ncbi:MAG TPA: DUF4389 domain-containing protein [Methylococcaceae bacterium]|jgi:hypothetical protein|nr:DUF4389 domain-containing protein [Methylococcaceae bacterium]HIN67829.1 DUF4389 domain-containing protein [Methylococcales bacterium]HIA45513.1 DUF4389 domain-containing protein [Methylococcaceae bacterium]HIB62902.1 DUF4389 domain-containing protein [Methylococcaceae bacterium]HIO12086.1 DUF4389 domain-containing protein [Methylococcales bacterium]
MQEDINQNLQKLSTWKRIFFMAIFAVMVSLVQIVLQLIILLQIASMLMTGNPNTNILGFGKKLSMYLYDIVLFLTFNSERLPFPFSEWSLTETLEKKSPR